jgi:DNA-binding CsgD family transcriptional regulator
VPAPQFLPRDDADLGPTENPSPREHDVLHLVAAGMSNREIGVRLGIAEQTVKNHMLNVSRRYQLRGRAQAVSAALARGWIGAVDWTTRPSEAGSDVVSGGDQ